MWVRNPDRVKAMIERQGEIFRLRFMRYSLFAGCKTGRNLQKAFGDELIEQITFEETTREIAGDPKIIFPADLGHIKACLELHKPTVVLAFGKIAHDAVRPLWTGEYISAHHPASRNPASYQTLIDAASRLRSINQPNEIRKCPQQP